MLNIATGNNNLEKKLMAGCVDATSLRSLRLHCTGTNAYIVSILGNVLFPQRVMTMATATRCSTP